VRHIRKFDCVVYQHVNKKINRKKLKKKVIKRYLVEFESSKIASEIRNRIEFEEFSKNSIDSDLEKKSSGFDMQRFHHEMSEKIMCEVVVLFLNI
jgi:hypothetical protein